MQTSKCEETTFDLSNKVIVITGGAGLLGKRFCQEVARQGGIAIVADRDADAARRVANEIALDYPGQALAVTLDITDAESAKELIEMLKTRYGRIDALVNNAYPRNGNYGRRLEDVCYADFCDNLSMHLGGYFLMSQQISLFFRQQGYGNIVNLASIYGVVAPRFEIYADTPMTMPVEYAAIKSGVIHLTKYFAQYFKVHGIRVNALSPGGIFDRQPDSFVERYNAMAGKKGMLEANDILGGLVFLLSDASRYMTGQNIVVDDGFTL